MAEQSHLHLLNLGIEAWNQWRQEHHAVQPDFSHADFRGAHLKRVNLSGARLNSADLSGADLSESLLMNADLSEADLSQANIKGARLGNAYFKHRPDILEDHL